MKFYPVGGRPPDVYDCFHVVCISRDHYAWKDPFGPYDISLITEELQSKIRAGLTDIHETLPYLQKRYQGTQ